jgi:hydrogen peroxide-inducible gene activator
VPIFDEKMLLAVSDQHPWASESKIAMNTLKGQEMLMLDDGHCLRNQALDYCFTAGAKEDSHFQATSLETLRNMVAANAGITFMPELAVLNEGTRPGVKYIPCHSPEPSRTIALVYRPGSPLRNRYERVASAVSEQVKSILANKK